MTRTIGILTYHRADNFGAVLQAFALQRTIAGLGYSCSIVDYRDPQEGAHRLFRVPQSRSSTKHDILLLMNLRSHLTAHKRFDRFRSDYLLLTSQSYRSMNDLLQGNLSFDIYVSGSDQVWHPDLLDGPRGPVFFLEFVYGRRRVAYAPSFGLDKMPTQYRDRAARLIRRFDFLSAREDSGCAIIRELTGRKAELVLDPTLLGSATEYNTLAVEPSLRKPYILLYPMQLSDRLRDLALKARASLKIPIVAVLPAFFEPWRFSFADKLVYNAGPAEFLGWMRTAAFVCTNSFHGTCFSIIYRKSFLSVPHLCYGTRVQSLLKRVDLLSRIVDEPDKVAFGDSRIGSLDYSPVKPLLQEAIDKSLGYLKRALA